MVTRPKEAAPLSFFLFCIHRFFPYTLSLFPFIFPFTPSTSLTHCSLFRVPVFPVFTFGTGFAFQPVNKRILYETILSTFCFCILLVGAECAGNAGNHLE
ncbi:putative membrane protein [Bacteroides fragilis str. DS-166]|uniref:Transmembrane protein n=1 Tax=Bacteroides fragilis (strain ATCC 25285 / DSM 2151 / CCUG 4856 / JCM 11019 / LMG 10263 / NCTC 9343 / Onslow / VPI 2553 / EN-2) TaxID=272559 RepID=Q5LFE0_BACFN|nr:putative membrane protein [Bacteroides fragilis str. DS-166]OOD24689.1 hypothetical protein BWP07_13825 [Bacteroides fragilis]CAH07155.1 hypothetical protein BF9343_1374 [Bacteroides fragilis NCTC 9343]